MRPHRHALFCMHASIDVLPAAVMQELETANGELAARCKELEHSVEQYRDSDAQLQVRPGLYLGWRGLAAAGSGAVPRGWVPWEAAC